MKHQDKIHIRERLEQAGAELCQAQVKLEVIVYIGEKVEVWIQLLARVMLNLAQVEVELEIEVELDNKNMKIWKIWKTWWTLWKLWKLRKLW